MTCVHFGRDQIYTQVNARFSSFGHPTQVNASLAVYFKYYITARAVVFRMAYFDKLRALASRLTSPFGQPTQVCTHVQLATTCVHLRYRLARALSMTDNRQNAAITKAR